MKGNNNILSRVWHEERHLWPFLFFLQVKTRFPILSYNLFKIFESLWTQRMRTCRNIINEEVGEKEMSKLEDSQKGSNSVKERGLYAQQFNMRNVWFDFTSLISLYRSPSLTPSKSHSSKSHQDRFSWLGSCDSSGAAFRGLDLQGSGTRCNQEINKKDYKAPHLNRSLRCIEQSHTSV